MRLLDCGTLVLQQVRALLTNDFDILDLEGTPVGTVHTGGSVLSRLFLNARHLTINDADGTPLLEIHDQPNLVRDTFTLTLPDGAELATIRKRFRLMRLSLSIESAVPLELEGSITGLDYRLGGIARVTRQWSGVGNALFGRSTYLLEITPGTPEQQRLLALGTAIVVDLIREKESG